MRVNTRYINSTRRTAVRVVKLPLCGNLRLHLHGYCTVCVVRLRIYGKTDSVVRLQSCGKTNSVARLQICGKTDSVVRLQICGKTDSVVRLQICGKTDDVVRLQICGKTVWQEYRSVVKLIVW